MRMSKAAVRRIGIGLGLVLLMNLLVLGLLARDSLSGEQAAANDALEQSTAGQLSQGTIVIAAIDDYSLKAYGRLESWDRIHYAELIRSLKDAGAQVVAFDVPLDFPTRNDPQVAAAIDYAMRPRDGTKPMLVIMGRTGTGVPKRVKTKGLMYDSFAPVAPAIAQAKPIEAAISFDQDGTVVRNLPLLYTDGKQQLLPLPLVAASAFARSVPGLTGDLEFEDQPYRLHLGPYQIPIDQYLRMPIYFFTKPTGYHNTAYSLAKIASGQVPAGALRNRLVLVGPYGGTGLADDYPVPTSSGTKMDGVEIWANATQSLIQGKFIVPEPFGQTVALMLALSLLAAFFFLRWGALGWVATIIIAAAFTGVRLIIERSQLLTPAAIGHEQITELPNFAYEAAAVLLSAAALFVFLFIDEQRRRSAVYNTFGRYVTPAVAQQLSSMQASGQLNLGGTRRVATVLFGNLYLPQGTHADDMLTLLNRYFDGMVHIVNKNGGTVNKFIGDHIMVLFNVPLDLPEHAAAACRTAHESLQWLQQYLAAHPSEQASFGVGINSGPLVAGNMGSRNRMEYTVLGDTVNTASRLSGVAGHDEIIISQATLNFMAGSGAKVEDRGEVRVKGKKEPVQVFKLLGFGDAGPVQILQPASAAAG